MSTTARARTNRANATRSTGPRSAEGKKRVAQNALRHRLAVPVAYLREYDGVLAELTRAIAGEGADARRLEVARRAAEARFEMLRARRAKRFVIEEAVTNPAFESRESRAAWWTRLWMDLQFVRYHEDPYMGRFLLSLDATIPESPGIPPVGPERIAVVVAELSKQLGRLDRYERRARSRYKFAIRELDQLPDPENELNNGQFRVALGDPGKFSQVAASA